MTGSELTCPDENFLAELAHGLLSAEQQAEFDAHLDDCPRCHHLVAQLGSAVPSNELGPGAIVDRYVVLDVVGVGAMGVVYAAYDPQLDRKVALKMLRAAELGDAEPEAATRLLREAQAMARLKSPHVVPVYGLGSFGAGAFIAMEFVDGQTVKQWLAERPRTRREIVEVFRQAGEGLAAAHDAGLVHRDFKPENVLVSRGRRVQVTDFGLARCEPATALSPAAPASSLDAPVTRTLLAGTPAYMAPEQLRGGTVDARSDQFAFCVALHEALYGERPFSGTTADQVAASFGDAAVPQPRTRRRPRWLRRVLARGLSIDVERRYPSMRALLAQLGERRRVAAALVLGAALVALAGGAAAVHFGSERRLVCTGGPRKVAAVWNPRANAAIDHAFRASGAPYANSVLALVARGLDTYQERWVDQYRDACEATEVHHDRSASPYLRMACLEQELWQTGELVEILSAADAGVVENASRAVAALPSPEQCARTAPLLGMPPLPVDRVARASIEAVRRQLERAKALRAAGRYADGLGVARRAVESTRTISYRPVQAEALLVLGDLQDLGGQYDLAEKSIYDALGPAEAAMHYSVAADAWIRLLFVEVHRARLDLGELWIPRAVAAVERLDGDPARQARLDLNMAAIAKARHHFGEAERLIRSAIEQLERPRTPDHIGLGNAYQALAATLDDDGQAEPALIAARRALAESEGGLGADHPQVARAMMTEGNALAELGRDDEAAAQLRRALTLLEHALGPEHPGVGNALVSLGAIAIEQHDYARAQDHLERAFRIFTRALPPRHPYLVTALDNFGDLWLEQASFARALAYYQQALSIVDGDSDGHRAYTLAGIGQSHLGLGQPAAAIAPLTQALGLLGGDRDGLGRAEAQFALARALWATCRETPRALELAGTARDTLGRLEHPRAKKELQALSLWLATRQDGLHPASCAEHADSGSH